MNGRRYMGIEDVKIFLTNNNSLKFIGTGYHKNNSLGIVIGDYDLNKNQLDYDEYTQSFKQSNCEKNWVFYKALALDSTSDKDELNIVYNWSPLVLCKMDTTNKIIIPIATKQMPKMFKYIRGSSCGFSYKDEIWFITHMVSHGSPRWYYHVIVVFDKDMNLLRFSPPFKLDNTPVEFSLSIIVDDDKIIIPYSKWDRETIIGVYDKKYVEGLLTNNK